MTIHCDSAVKYRIENLTSVVQNIKYITLPIFELKTWNSFHLIHADLTVTFTLFSLNQVRQQLVWLDKTTLLAHGKMFWRHGQAD